MRYLIPALICLPVLALDNGVTIHEASGTNQTGRPVSVFRAFARGEFSGTYPKPRIGGTVPAAWQVDVKTTWPDGSVQQAFISFRLGVTANGSAAVDFVADANPCHLGNLATCQAAALNQAGMLSYDTGGGAGSWSATWYGSLNSIEYSASARTMLGAGSWRYWMRGPVVTAVIVEDRSTALSHDFGWEYTTAWVAPANENRKSLHPVYELRFYPDPDGAGALTNWPGVEVDAQIWNATILRFQRFDSINLTLKTGNAEAATAYSVTGKSFHARSRRHKLTWSGTAPGAVVMDYNFPYLIHTRMIPSYDYRLGVAATLADGDLSAYNTQLGPDEPQWCDTNVSFAGNWRKGVGTTGARGEIALTARWYLNYLYLMGHSGVTTAKKKEIWDKLIIGNADAGGHAPIHYMEGATTLTYYADQGPDNAVGRPVSIDARGIWASGTFEATYSNPKTYVCEAAPCDGRLTATANPYRGSWYADGETQYTSHAPSINAIPYFLTGYHYYLTGTQFEAAFGLATTTAGVGSASSTSARHGPRGIIFNSGVHRATAWMHRNIAWATILTPDGEIEKGYFKSRLQNNAAFHEGLMLLTGGAHVPANPACPTYVRSDSTVRTADMWCAGRHNWQARDGAIPPGNPTFVATMPSVQNQNDGLINGHRRAPGYWLSYVAAVWAWLSRTGAIIDKDNLPMMKHLSDAVAAHYAGRVLVSPSSMYQMRVDDWGWGPGTKALCETFEECASSFISSWTLSSDMTNAQTSLVIDHTDWEDTGYSPMNTAWARIGNEYVRLSGNPQSGVPSSGKSTVTISQRGVWGSTATPHTAGATVTWMPGFQDIWAFEYQGGYPNLARAAMALMADADKKNEYSPLRAYQQFGAALPFQNYEGNPQWAVMPGERVQSVAATGGTGTAALSWLAPPATVCKVYLGATAPATSSDATDATADATKGRWQTHSATGLSAGTNHYRISCGTARAAGTVTVGAGA